MRMCDFEWVYLVKFIHLRDPYMFLVVFRGGVFLGVILGFWKFWKLFWSENVWLWEEVYLLKFIHFRAPYMICGCLVLFGVNFWGIFWIFVIFENVFEMRMCGFGVYIWFLVIWLFLEIFSRGIYLLTFIYVRAPYMIFGF